MPSSVGSIEDLEASLLAFLAADPGRMARFFNLTGLRPDRMREAASAPGFAASVLDYVLGDEPLLSLFASASGIKPEDLARVRASLERGPPEPRPDPSPTAAPRGLSNLSRRFGGA